MQIDLRPARLQDFDYCARLYFAAMKSVIRELNLDLTAHTAGFRQQWDPAQVRIITFDRADIGWLQSVTKKDALYLAQLFVDSAFQRRSIGTCVMHRLIAEAAHSRLPMTLSVVKTNPAIRLYQRLGFRVTHEDDRKFHMRRDLDASSEPQSPH